MASQAARHVAMAGRKQLVGVILVVMLLVFFQFYWYSQVLLVESNLWRAETLPGISPDGRPREDAAMGSHHIDSLQKLLDWVRGPCGGYVAPVGLALFKGIRGQAGLTETLAGEVLFRLPARCLLTRQTAFASFPDQKGPGFSEWFVMSLYLVEQRVLGNDSWWASYLAVLPSYEEYASFLPIAALAGLREEGHEVLGLREIASVVRTFPELGVIVQREQMLREEYLKYKQLVPNARASWFDIVWGASVSLSRTFHSSEFESCLVPLYDLCNTYADGSGGGEPSTIWHSHLEEGCFVARSSVDLRAGDEWTARYWFHSDEAHAVDTYGFRAGEGLWRLGRSTPERDEHCDRWRTSAVARMVQSSAPLLPVVQNLAELVREVCSKRMDALWREAKSRTNTYSTWLEALLFHGDLRYIAHGMGYQLRGPKGLNISGLWD